MEKNNLFKLYTKGSTLKEWHHKLFLEAKKYKLIALRQYLMKNIEFLEKLSTSL